MFNEYAEMANELDSMCENGEYRKQGLAHLWFCKRKNTACAYIRWCQTEKRIKMTDKYLECPLRNQQG